VKHNPWRYLLLIGCLSVFFLRPCFAAPVSVLKQIVVNKNAEKLSLHFVLTAPTQYKMFTLTNPNRVAIDFYNTKTALNVRASLSRIPLISNVRQGSPHPNVLRVVLDLGQSLRVDTSVSHATRQNYGVLMNLYSRATQGVHTTQQKKIVQTYEPIHHAPPLRGLRDVVVVLDPGHGGRDPGAVGLNHHAEKDVVLSIAQKLKQRIDSQPGMRAVLTRNGDYYIGLRQRLDIARKNNADLFIAIHADAFANHQSNGASVFALSPRGATSEAARWLAEKENYSELGGVNLSQLDDQNGVIRTVLIDLSQTATIGASLQMGNHLLRHLRKLTSLHNNKVEQARFVVLKSPDIPSVLIETGFISNLREERNLSNPAYQHRLTQAILAGITGYFWDYPPHGSRLEAISNARRPHLAYHPSLRVS
jgi:N-acetylmuramoyl-L-alanine amidase